MNLSGSSEVVELAEITITIIIRVIIIIIIIIINDSYNVLL